MKMICCARNIHDERQHRPEPKGRRKNHVARICDIFIDRKCSENGDLQSSVKSHIALATYFPHSRVMGACLRAPKNEIVIQVTPLEQHTQTHSHTHTHTHTHTPNACPSSICYLQTIHLSFVQIFDGILVRFSTAR